MKGRIVGIRTTKFTAEKTGEVISGKTVYFLSEADNVEGYMADRIFLSEAKLAHYQPVLNDVVDIQYNRFGKVESVVKTGTV